MSIKIYSESEKSSKKRLKLIKLAKSIKRASPAAWQNINLKGKYLFAEGGETPEIEYLMAPIEDYLSVPEK